MLILCLWFFPVTLVSQSFKTDPAKPIQNQKITFLFNSDKISPELVSVNLILIKQLDAPSDTLPMSPANDTWTVNAEIKDSTVSALFFYFEGKDKTGNPFSLKFEQGPFECFFHTIDGAPVKNAYMSSALVWSGYNDLRQPDMDKAIQAIDQELKLYPDHYQARLLKYTLLLKHEKNLSVADFLIREDVEKTLKRENESITSLEFAMQAYQMIEYEKGIEKIQALIIKKNPGGEQEAVQVFNEIMSLEDTDLQTEQLENFIKKYPASRMCEIALSQLASIYIEQDDSTAMLDVGDQLLQHASTMSGASGLSALAGVLAEKMYKLEKAQNYIEKALALIQHINPKDHPPEISDNEWQERIRYTTARYQDISGWIYFKQKNYSQALDLLETASRNTMEPGILYHLAEIQYRLHQEDAIRTYARVAAFGGVIADSARNKLDIIWKTSNRDSSELETLLSTEQNQVQNDYTTKILKRRNIQSLPDFSTERLNGGNCKSSDILGKPTLLCFIATWSEASAQMMNALIDMFYQRDDIQFFIIAVDRNPSTVSQYVRDNRIPLPFLLSNQQMEDVFGLRGVPVLFVIDAHNRIHFQHKGYRPDIEDILNIELDHLD